MADTRWLPAVGMLAIAESARRARRRDVGGAEERLFRVANDAPDEIELPVWTLMQAGSLAAVFVVSGGLARLGRVTEASSALAAGVGVWAGVKVVKPLVGRGRPAAVLDSVAVRGQPQTGLGYPSGHAAVALTLALASTRAARPWLRGTAVALAGVVGVARVYVGAHLPLDVVGGLGMGMLGGRAARALARTIDNR